MGKDLKSDFIRFSSEPQKGIVSGLTRIPAGRDGFVRFLINIAAEKCENFFGYLRKLGLTDRQNLIVLSSRDYFNCDRKKLDEVKTLVNRRKLNLIRHLDMFLLTLVRILPGNTSFVGCFSESRGGHLNSSKTYNPVCLLNRFFNRLDTSSQHRLDKDEVADMLERSGLTIVDMTELNGLIYFCSRKICNQIELSA